MEIFCELPIPVGFVYQWKWRGLSNGIPGIHAPIVGVLNDFDILYRTSIHSRLFPLLFRLDGGDGRSIKINAFACSRDCGYVQDALLEADRIGGNCGKSLTHRACGCLGQTRESASRELEKCGPERHGPQKLRGHLILNAFPEVMCSGTG